MHRNSPPDGVGESQLDADQPPGDGDLSEGTLPRVLAAFLIVVVAGGSLDLVLDRPQSWLSFHVLFELALILACLAFALALWRGWRVTARDLARARSSLATVTESLARRQDERDAWRRSAEQALAGLGLAIDRQFAAWNLTAAEREVALLLLKGHGHKQVAAVLERSERTVRQHAVAIYHKAGLRSRAELAAFFLQDLMLPDGRRPGVGEA